LALVVLLPEGEPRPRIAGNQDAGLCAVDARLPGSFGGHLAVVELLRVLAEVPDVPVRVLRVPVVRVLLHLPVLRQDIVHDERVDAEDPLRFVRDRHLGAADVPFGVRLAVHPAASVAHRPVRIVDVGREVLRVELHLLAPLRKRRAGATTGSEEEDEGGDGQAHERRVRRPDEMPMSAPFITISFAAPTFPTVPLETVGG